MFVQAHRGRVYAQRKPYHLRKVHDRQVDWLLGLLSRFRLVAVEIQMTQRARRYHRIRSPVPCV